MRRQIEGTEFALPALYQPNSLIPLEIWKASLSTMSKHTEISTVTAACLFQASNWYRSSCLSSTGAQRTSQRLHTTHHSRVPILTSRRKRRAHTLTSLSLSTPHAYPRQSIYDNSNTTMSRGAAKEKSGSWMKDCDNINL